MSLRPADAIAAAILLLGIVLPSHAETVPAPPREIYRCHALDGSQRFQDRPCRSEPGTREAAKAEDGERLALPPPPADDEGTPAREHYARYLEQLAATQREQRDAEAAANARLQAQAEADRAAAERARAEACVPRADRSGCSDDGFATPPLFYAWRPLPPVHALRPPTPVEPPRRLPRPIGPNEAPRPPLRDARSEILSLSP